mmetsp:Transcript_50859/g.143170  ORF Transcript_50859/g.143170 Transcript_50859/m.143170 type:complete len:139 (+) Transcript_50859:66-482(+)
MASLLSVALRRCAPTALGAAGGSSRIGGALAGLAPLLPPGYMREDRRWYRHRGVLKLHCNECRYIIRRWHVPILAVDCNANPRHKQAMTNTPIRSRWSAQFPDNLAPWVEGKQYPRWPHYRAEWTFQCYHKKRHLRLR